MGEKYAIHWLEPVVQEILARNQEPIVISAGKTTSGHVHMGFMREIIIGDAIRRILQSKGKDVIFRIFLDTYDAAKRFPPYIDKSYANKYVGRPFARIPSPFNDIKANSYAEYFGKELINAFPDFGVEIQVIWTHKLYQQADMQEQIRIGLEKANLVKEIVLSHLTHAMTKEEKEERYKMYEHWMPAMVVCESCGRTQIKNTKGEISPNRVIQYNKEKDTVSYNCPACEYAGEVLISSGLVKLNWRLDWPAKWALDPKNLFECSGKDHFTKITGSWDVATDLCIKIYNYIGPVGLGFEWMRLGDTDMGTSKGIVFMPKTYYSMAEPELLRMLVLTTNPSRHISFRIEELALLYDEYERIERIYYEIEEPFDLDKKVGEFKTRIEKDLIRDLEIQITREINIEIQKEVDPLQRENITKNKKNLIKERMKKQSHFDIHPKLEKKMAEYVKTEEKERERVKREVKFLYPLIYTKRLKKRCPPQIPLKFLVNMVQLREFISFDEIMKKAQLTQRQKQISAVISKSYLRKRLQQTSRWLDYIKTLIEKTEDPTEKVRLESKVDLFEVPKILTPEILKLIDSEQRRSLKVFSEWLLSVEEVNEETLKVSMIQIRESTGISVQKLFQVIYLILIGRTTGPRLGPFMSLMDLNWIRHRFSIFRNE